MYDTYDEVVRYKAYQFPDNMNFDAGMVKVNSKGTKDINTGFQPANLHIRGAQQLINKETVRTFHKNDDGTEGDTTHGRSKGYATLDKDGNVIDQQSIGTASNSHSTNGHRSLASDQDIINTVYVDREGNEIGRFAAKITGADSSGFTVDVNTKYTDNSNVETDEVFLYRAWGFSYYEFDIGY
ncbi:MAG: hypothetical protein ABEJ98_05835, partial [Candidatus Nanohaloarchaea archaeon]